MPDDELFRMAEELRQQAEERVALAREQAGRAAAEEAARRSAFLADAGKNMARSLNLEATARTILDLVVPELADSATLRLQSNGAETIYTCHRDHPDGVGGLPGDVAAAMDVAASTLSR
jgi:hypothetical protein